MTLIADAVMYTKVATPTAKPRTSFTGDKLTVAKNPPVPTNDL